MKYIITIGCDILDATVAKFLHNRSSRAYLNLSYGDIQVYMCWGLWCDRIHFHNTSQCTITGVCIYSPTAPPPLILVQFFSTPSPFRFSFLSSILYHSSSLSLPGMERQNICSPLPPSYTPHLLPICYHIIFDGADRVRGRRREGRERKEVVGVGRGMKNVKIFEGMEKRKILRVPLRRKEEGDKGRVG